MTTPRRSTFKRPRDYYTLYPRPSSPEQPIFEPLSPPAPIEPTFNYPALPRTLPDAQVSRHHRQSFGSGYTSIATGPQWPDLSRKVHRSPSTIDDLAEVALAVSPTLPLGARNNSYSQYHDVRQQPGQYHGHSHVFGSPPTRYGANERPTKRARSDVGQSPATYPSFVSRPSTSYLPAYGVPHNVERSIDQARRESTNSSNLEDAELLLNFANRVAPRPARIPSPVHERIITQPSEPPQSAPEPPSSTLQPGPDPLTSLPSPRDTLEDDGQVVEKAAVINEQPQIQTQEHEAEEVQSRTIQIHNLAEPKQTQTPPEDVQTVSHQTTDPKVGASITSKAEKAVNAAIEDFAVEDKVEDDKPKQKRGWPKGKPRGPRKSTGTVKPRPSSAKRLRKSTLGGRASSVDADSRPPAPRRKSEADYTITFSDLAGEPISRASSVPADFNYVVPSKKPGRKALPKVTQDTVCAECQNSRDSPHAEHEQWISCNGCKEWVHSHCAGFQNEREVRDVDKFFCKTCEPKHGATTFVRKSTRAHTAVDYAGLNQGVLKTSDDCNEHHYIQPIKDGTFTFDPETFPRMRPELVTAEYFERCAAFTEPILIPAEFNPKPKRRPLNEDVSVQHGSDEAASLAGEDVLTEAFEYETVPDDGQDKLDMVIPQDLTVRKVMELVGPDYPLEVIDVKIQGTEGGKWDMRKWADYYESEGEKAIRNVISLEVSNTRLGKLLRRPKVVRQIDLQDNVWPAEEPAKSVAFYCLMSVADSYTDFHIDFGGSSVYYHILRGSKTFFFIPPKPKHLKAYEDWNNSHEQNFTFLPHITKECYRVDLAEGDTMLIPSGWIHAVWTPSNSLVIGGNFLTHLHYSAQFRVVDVEKANKTPQKFRYPAFQKVMWYSVIKYLNSDPLPEAVRESFYSGNKFRREQPTWQAFDEFGPNSEPGDENYHARYYSQSELDGLPELVSFIFRTVMISLGRIEGVTEETRKAVVRSIPKSHGEPLEIARTFALWVAWKRGNEDPPAWAHPDAVLPNKEGSQPKKLSARLLKQMQRQEAIEAYRIAPDRQSARQAAKAAEASVTSDQDDSPAPSSFDPLTGQYTSTPKTSVLGPKRIACDTCRKRRIRCKHKDVLSSTPNGSYQLTGVFSSKPDFNGWLGEAPSSSRRMSLGVVIDNAANRAMASQMAPLMHSQMMAAYPPQIMPSQVAHSDLAGPAAPPAANNAHGDSVLKRGRSKACLECRKSKVCEHYENVANTELSNMKRKCIHDENGRIDPIKAAQIPTPRASGPKKRKSIEEADITPSQKRIKQQDTEPAEYTPQYQADQVPNMLSTIPYQFEAAHQPNMMPAQNNHQHQYPDPATSGWQIPYTYPDPQDSSHNDGMFQYSGDGQISYSMPSLQQFANEVLDAGYVNGSNEQYQDNRQHLDDQMYPAMQQPYYGNGQHSMVGSLDTKRPDKTDDSIDSGVSLSDNTPPAVQSDQDQTASHREIDGQQRARMEAYATAVRLSPTQYISSQMPEAADSSRVVRSLPLTTVEGTNEEEDTIVVNLSHALRHIVSNQCKQPELGEKPSEIHVHKSDDAIAGVDGCLTANQIDEDVADVINVAAPVKSENDLSPPLSPLTEPPVSPKPIEASLDIYIPPERQSSRRAKPVERLSSISYDPPRERSSKSKTPVPLAAPSTTNTNNKRRKSTTPALPTNSKLNNDIEGLGQEPDRELTAAELEEQKNLRLARELQGQSFGLRRR